MTAQGDFAIRRPGSGELSGLARVNPHPDRSAPPRRRDKRRKRREDDEQAEATTADADEDDQEHDTPGSSSIDILA